MFNFFPKSTDNILRYWGIRPNREIETPHEPVDPEVEALNREIHLDRSLIVVTLGTTAVAGAALVGELMTEMPSDHRGMEVFTATLFAGYAYNTARRGLKIKRNRKEIKKLEGQTEELGGTRVID